MEIIFILIGISFTMAVGFLISFIWTIKSGQNEDLEGPPMRILHERKSNNQ
ncbi:MAG: Cytochrome oxidase maturation protein cbb3-type [Bacteroidota bacterium]|jgi:cbb3-type cytochrome oxidase maturation protein